MCFSSCPRYEIHQRSYWSLLWVHVEPLRSVKVPPKLVLASLYLRMFSINDPLLIRSLISSFKLKQSLVSCPTPLCNWHNLFGSHFATSFLMGGDTRMELCCPRRVIPTHGYCWAQYNVWSSLLMASSASLHWIKTSLVQHASLLTFACRWVYYHSSST